MWQTHPVLIALVTIIVGCSDDLGDPPPPPSGGGGGYGCGAQTELRAGNVRAWISYVSCLPNGRVAETEAEIDQHRGDDTIASELLDIVEGEWGPDGLHGDYGVTLMAIAVARQMGNESVLVRSEALVWRPLPPVNEGSHIGSLEGKMAETIACIRTRAGAAAAQRIIDSHPNDYIRFLAADMLENPNCRFGAP